MGTQSGRLLTGVQRAPKQTAPYRADALLPTDDTCWLDIFQALLSSTDAQLPLSDARSIPEITTKVAAMSCFHSVLQLGVLDQLVIINCNMPRPVPT